MHIFEYPHIIITVLALWFVLFVAGGIFFAARAIKAASGKDEKNFVSLGKLGKSFAKSGKEREDRCVFYISVLPDNFRSLYSASEAEKVLLDIKHVLLDEFSGDDGSGVAQYGDRNFIAFTKWDMETTRRNVNECLSKLNACLLKYSALNIVEIKIGSYFAFGTHVEFEEAVNRAKKACMLAENEKLSYAEWDAGSGRALDKKIKIENNIEREIDNNKFFLEYQPVLDAKTKKVTGAEVLSRLNSENHGVLTPGSFLSAVDSVGLNCKFDYYIFEKNCKWIANNKAQREKFKYTINFSRSTLCRPDFAERIISITEKYNLKFSCLAVEILEDKNITGEARSTMISNLSKLKERGMSILLDDFGSGFTTFSDLQSLDISVVKIDKSITQNSTTDTGFIILKNIISTAKDIGFRTLCEGVETKEQEEAAIRAGCDMLQGFYYYRPMPVAMLEKVFDEN